MITIGFDKANYSVNECDGIVSINVEVKHSQPLERQVIVYLSTSVKDTFGEGKEIWNIIDVQSHCYVC